ncbi:tropinone reductase-like 3 [Quercus lobata]|uniref:tropinone reductase-like 3 n=1 Tax=Quercus lobata TaxID=97700 RepID=UPI001245E091|nr:tropinone reductase-like 3 [Quercus lobata]
MAKSPATVTKWSPPLGEGYKTNYDGAVFEEAGEAGIGVVVQNGNGEVLAALLEKIPYPGTVELVEILAARRAVQFIAELGMAQSIFEGDSESVYKALKSGDVGHSSIGQYVKDIMSISGLIRTFSFSHIRRQGNCVAHVLTKRARFAFPLLVWMEHVPPDVIPFSKFGKRYEGKVAIVTASTQGIGFSIAERLGLEGASVVVSSRKQKYGKIDVVVSNAAANPSFDDILQTQESVLDKLWEINVKSSILILQDASPHLQKGSSVVIISSFTAYQPPATIAMYGVTKTALLGLTKALAAEMAPNTRVNCVAPGFVPTRSAALLRTNDAFMKEIEQGTLLNRLGTTQDMAAATAFLASDDASYITGEILVVAGGLPSRL